jgi:ketosteroid isomerase-like protein
MTVTSGYVREIFKSLKYGDGVALFAHVAADVDWGVMGAHPFSGNYRSRPALVAGTFAKLAEVLPQGAQLHVEHLIVRNNQASISLHALVAAKNGMWFDNHYRWIVCFRGEEIVSVRGYPDSIIDSAAGLSSEPTRSASKAATHDESRRRSTYSAERDMLLPSRDQEFILVRANGRTESELMPCAPWMSTPSISAVVEGSLWNATERLSQARAVDKRGAD